MEELRCIHEFLWVAYLCKTILRHCPISFEPSISKNVLLWLGLGSLSILFITQVNLVRYRIARNHARPCPPLQRITNSILVQRNSVKNSKWESSFWLYEFASIFFYRLDKGNNQHSEEEQEHPPFYIWCELYSYDKAKQKRKCVLHSLKKLRPLQVFDVNVGNYQTKGKPGISVEI